jgi:FHA domain
MSSENEKTRIIRPLDKLQSQTPPESKLDPDPTRKMQKPEDRGDDTALLTRRVADHGKTVLAGPISRDPVTEFNPLAPREEVSDSSSDPVVGWLVVIKGPGRGNSLRLGYGWNNLGRDVSQRVRLDFGDSKISRFNHSRLLYDPRARRFTITLGEGTNPTYVRGEALLGPLELKSGDRIQIGDTELLFVALCDENFEWQDEV